MFTLIGTKEEIFFFVDNVVNGNFVYRSNLHKCTDIPNCYRCYLRVENVKGVFGGNYEKKR